MFKQILGFIMLSTFIGFMVYKFDYFFSGRDDAYVFVTLIFVVMVLILMAIRKILVEG